MCCLRLVGMLEFPKQPQLQPPQGMFGVVSSLLDSMSSGFARRLYHRFHLIRSQIVSYGIIMFLFLGGTRRCFCSDFAENHFVVDEAAGASKLGELQPLFTPWLESIFKPLRSLGRKP